MATIQSNKPCLLFMQGHIHHDDLYDTLFENVVHTPWSYISLNLAKRGIRKINKVMSLTETKYVIAAFEARDYPFDATSKTFQGCAFSADFTKTLPGKLGDPLRVPLTKRVSKPVRPFVLDTEPTYKYVYMRARKKKASAMDKYTTATVSVPKAKAMYKHTAKKKANDTSII